ncbi:hypothetical protein [Aquiflexum lacus]|uniref:hypothetical protein n=1 Tax=Aquiflexum lacus TaxID=2483805 RepID=UPI0018935CC7|nr:hypothetical protein [Aquiflexum lacus]
MDLLKKFKSFLILPLVFGFLFATATTSCGNKKTAEDTEHVEHSHDGDEHPSGGDEHPKSDTTGSEHPNN